MTVDILVDSSGFWESLKADVLSSRKNVYIQTMSFEGDSAGKKLSDLLLSSTSEDIRMLADSYIKYFLSDKFLYTPQNIFSRALREEVKETNGLIKLLSQNGVQVKFTNPVGPFLKKFIRRNHKKMILIDDKIAYIGGINFCDHNFLWHDMMLRIENAEITNFLKEDFLTTWNGQNKSIFKNFGDIQIRLLDGYHNHGMLEHIFKTMETAQNTIIVESPYLTFPFYEKLSEVKQNNVSITVIAPEYNNRRIYDGYTRWKCMKSGFDLRLYKGRVTHLKAMLIDDDYLIVGSSNFELASYFSQEIIVTITNKDVISSFMDKVIKNDLRNSVKFDMRMSKAGGYMQSSRLQLIMKLLKFICKIW